MIHNKSWCNFLQVADDLICHISMLCLGLIFVLMLFINENIRPFRELHNRFRSFIIFLMIPIRVIYRFGFSFWLRQIHRCNLTSLEDNIRAFIHICSIRNSVKDMFKKLEGQGWSSCIKIKSNFLSSVDFHFPFRVSLIP